MDIGPNIRSMLYISTFIISIHFCGCSTILSSETLRDNPLVFAQARGLTDSEALSILSKYFVQKDHAVHISRDIRNNEYEQQDKWVTDISGNTFQGRCVYHADHIRSGNTFSFSVEKSDFSFSFDDLYEIEFSDFRKDYYSNTMNYSFKYILWLNGDDVCLKRHYPNNTDLAEKTHPHSTGLEVDLFPRFTTKSKDEAIALQRTIMAAFSRIMPSTRKQVVK